MNNQVSMEVRLHFRDWLREELKKLEFYQRRGDHFLIREFHKYTEQKGHLIDEASLGRYLRDEQPVLPTPERCRDLASVLEMPEWKVLFEAGYLRQQDIDDIKSDPA